jgi:dTDP-4-dehydrorhamnose 3,5-epimerase
MMGDMTFNPNSFFKIKEVDGAFFGQNRIHKDNRGTFRRAFDFEDISNFLEFDGFRRFNPVNTNLASNLISGTWRGLHMQKHPYSENKIVTVVEGSILDIFVDLRENSDTFLNLFEIELSASEGNFVYIPKGCAHGYLTLESNTTVMYVVDEPHSPESEVGFCVKDPSFGISFRHDISIMSDKDSIWPHRKLA